jgi:MFS family permease
VSRKDIYPVDLRSTLPQGTGQLSANLIAGVLSGIVGLLAFLVIHHFWIAPIWFILPLGLVMAAVGGLAVGWAYHELSPSLPPRPWSTLAVVALIGIILIPSIALAELREPLFTSTETGAELSVSVGYATAIFILELLVTATLTGGLAGWLIGGTSRAALATGIAGLVFALGPGHNIPFLGNTPASGKGIVVLLIIILSAAVVLVEMSAMMSGWVISQNEKELISHE